MANQTIGTFFQIIGQTGFQLHKELQQKLLPPNLQQLLTWFKQLVCQTLPMVVSSHSNWDSLLHQMFIPSSQPNSKEMPWLTSNSFRQFLLIPISTMFMPGMVLNNLEEQSPWSVPCNLKVLWLLPNGEMSTFSSDTSWWMTMPKFTQSGLNIFHPTKTVESAHINQCFKLSNCYDQRSNKISRRNSSN